MIELIGPICGVTLSGSWLVHQREPFGDQLAVAVDVGAPIELDIDDRKPDARDRAHAAHAGHAVHLGFDRKTDELLDFRRRVAFRLRHDRDGRTVEVGEHVDRQLARGIGAENDEDGGDRQNQQAVAERGADQECEHVPVPQRTWSSSSAPCDTIRFPGSKPDTISTRSPSSGSVRTLRGMNRSGATCS